MQEQPPDIGGGEGVGVGQAQQRTQHQRADGGKLGGVVGQPRPGGLGGCVGEVLEERGGRPDTGCLVSSKQVRGVLVKEREQAAAGPERKKNAVARGSAQPASSRASGSRLV